MKEIIESYTLHYKEYKQSLYKKLYALIALFILPFLPTAIFYDQSLFIRILFWIFLSLMLIFLIILIALMLYTTERPMYEFLYKDIVDEAFKDDYTHYEFEAFPKQIPFFKRGQLMTDTNSELVKYRLTFYYTSKRIDLYSLYAYANDSKSIDPVFNGIYYVIHNHNKKAYKVLSNEKTSKNNALDEVNHNKIALHQDIVKKMESDVYINGFGKETHIAINKNYDHIKPKNILEADMKMLEKDIWDLVKYGRKLYRDLENTEINS